MPSVYTCLNANEQNMKFHQYENSNETHWTFNTIGVNGHLPPVVSVLCVDMRCYFVLRSVWAATTSWTLRSRRTPAYSVGAADSPATLSKAPSPLTTCPTVTKESGRHLVLRACELCVCDAALFFIFLFFLQATTRCSSSPSEPPPSPSGRPWPLATTWVSHCPPTDTPPTPPLSDCEVTSHLQPSRTCGANTTSTATG